MGIVHIHRIAGVADGHRGSLAGVILIGIRAQEDVLQGELRACTADLSTGATTDDVTVLDGHVAAGDVHGGIVAGVGIVVTLQIHGHLFIQIGGSTGLIVPQHFYLLFSSGSIGKVVIGILFPVGIRGAFKGVGGDMEDAQEAGPQGDHLFLHFFKRSAHTGFFRFHLCNGEILLGGILGAVGGIIVVFLMGLFGRGFIRGSGFLRRGIPVGHPGDLLFIHAVDAHVHLILGGGNLFLFGGFVCRRIDIFDNLTLDNFIAVFTRSGNGTIQRNVIGNIGDITFRRCFNSGNRCLQVIGFLCIDLYTLGGSAGIFNVNGGLILIDSGITFRGQGIRLGGKLHADGLIVGGIRDSYALFDFRLIGHGQIAAVAFGQAVRLGQGLRCDRCCSSRLLRRQLGQQLLPQNLPLLVRDIFRAGQVHFRLCPHGHAQHDHAQHQNQRQQP